MASTRLSVLIIDDEQDTCELIAQGLQGRGFAPTWRTSAKEALALLDDEDFDAIITDLHIGEESGLDVCKQVNARRPELPVLVVTAFGSMDSAIEAVRARAYDFVQKPVDLDALVFSLDRAVRHYELHREVTRLRAAVTAPGPISDIIGESRAMQTLFDLLKRLDGSDASALITGESGTGKELVARALHQRGRTSKGPFVAVNCAAVPAALLESTLFGHVRGAFTDAKDSRQGLFVEADGGSLLLDEVGEMVPEMQSKLLRVLQERTVRPVGGTKEIPFDTRILSSTNRDLFDEVNKGRFREDLLYRINVVTIEVPPLRDRGNDILVLAQYYIDRFAQRSGKEVKGLSSDAAHKLLDFGWPGNVRQLENVIQRAVTLTRFDNLTIDDLPESIASYRSDRMVMWGSEAHELLTLSELERRYLEHVLKTTGGNKTRAAAILGVDRRTLHRKLSRLEHESRAESEADERR